MQIDIINIVIYIVLLLAIAVIAALAGNVRRNITQSKRRDYLLDAVNNATVILLRSGTERFEEDLRKSLGIFGEALGVERVSIWKNFTRDGDLYCSRISEWVSSINTFIDRVDTIDVPYSEKIPSWERILSEGDCVNSTVYDMPKVERTHLDPQGMKAVFITPVFIRGQFWGYIGYDNFTKERIVPEYERTVMQAGGLLIANAILRNDQSIEIHEAHERSRLLLDATPLACRLWNKNHEVIELNEATVKLFKAGSKDEIMADYFTFSPEQQPDGMNSREKIHLVLDRVFAEGSLVLDWVHRSMDGELLPVEITLVRLNFGGEDVIAGYTRDMREYNKMIREITRRDDLLNIINEASAIMLQSEIDAFAKDLVRCMEKLGKAIGVDSITIWKNHKRDNDLYYSKVFEWRDGISPPEDKGYVFESDHAEDKQISYKERIPGWEEALSAGNCINMFVSDMPVEVQERFIAQGVRSVFTTPVFINDNFWGFVGYDNYLLEQIYTQDEQIIMRSGGWVISSALLRNEMMLNIRETSKRLEEALAEAQSASNAKSDFLAKMSHEMRTPLNAVIGLSGLSLDAGNLDDEVNANLEKIYNAGATLLGTVNDILDISKIEAGRLELVETDYDVPSLINDTVTQNVLRIGDKPIEFKLDVDENMFAKLYGDELRVKQIINNLLSNAIKYTSSGMAKLTIRSEGLSRRGSSLSGADEGEMGVMGLLPDDVKEATVWLTIQVSDTGRGIKPEDIGRLFSDYTQMDLGSNREIEGTGLGLPITKRLAEMMGGSIGVVSEYGTGSVFTVKIAQKYVSDEKIGPQIVESLKSFRYTDNKRNSRVRGDIVKLPYARVLVVDDNITNLDVAKGLMAPYNMRIDCVTSGQQAIDAMRSETIRYNAVFMDHMMPGLDGVEAAELIRELGTEYAQNIPIIMFTANAIVGNEEMYLSKGFQAFLSKPIDPLRLDEVINNWVRDKENEKKYSDMLFPDDDFLSEEERRSVTSRRSGIDRRKANLRFVGLDIDKGIERFNGDRDIYFKVIQSYIVHTRTLLDSIEKVNKDSLHDYAITVHGIKGSSRGIFADMIGDAAENLEIAAKSGDFNYIVTHNEVFLKTVWKLIFDLEDLLASVQSGKPKPVKDKPDHETLSKLLSACKSYNMDEVDDVMTELESYQYTTGYSLASWLIESIKRMNFKEIIERLSGENAYE